MGDYQVDYIYHANLFKLYTGNENVIGIKLFLKVCATTINMNYAQQLLNVLKSLVPISSQGLHMVQTLLLMLGETETNSLLCVLNSCTQNLSLWTKGSLKMFNNWNQYQLIVITENWHGKIEEMIYDSLVLSNMPQMSFPPVLQQPYVYNPFCFLPFSIYYNFHHHSNSSDLRNQVLHRHRAEV